MKFLSPILSALLLVFGLSCTACADVLELPSKVTAVTVYPGAAHLTRTVTLDLSAGDHTIIFDKITPPLDENTLSVTGDGVASVKIYGGYIKQEFIKESPDERVKALRQKIQDIDDEIINQNNAT